MNGIIWGISIGLGLSALYKKQTNWFGQTRQKELNDDIVELIKERMEKGRKEYGHGLLRGDRDLSLIHI